nr:LOW QUALITY PROTEIN: zinc finger protein 488 [Pelodiscus sinensis]|eukprot:XP_025037950.1 LOW QUALITY PROTEIN: zinc finger protein 488 [Pelodiscus sinensis]
MRLVQPAAGGKEQNLEAYLKHSQLYYRPTRKIGKTEELLVWYDEELSSLLGFSALKARTLPADLRCPACGQAFKGQHCYLAHVRFLCALEKHAPPGSNLPEQKRRAPTLPRCPRDFSFVWPARARGEQKSAFSKPTKGLAGRALGTSSHPTTEFIPAAAITCYGSLVDSKFLVRGLCNSQALQASLSRGDAVPCPSDPWPKQPGGQLQTPAPSSSSSSLPLLPPTFTSFGVAAQNWCAKCNLSFRMTSDLVFHMRSHHKKDYASPESQCKRRREEKLTCPICHEYFRERHHLSRHMTSHN